MRTTTKFLGATLLSLSLAAVPLALPAHAQEAGTDTTNTTNTTETGQDRDFDWGWLGLLGLIGLAGFAGKRSADHQSASHHNLNTRDLNEVNRPAGTRYQDPDQIDRSSTNRY